MAYVTHEALFNKLQDHTVLGRCDQYAGWTLPYLMARIDEIAGSGRVVVERDFQEVGALFVNNLASKLVRILFPTQYPFFQASASPKLVERAKKGGTPESALRSAFSRMEMQSNRNLFANAGYASLILALKHLIVTGNVLIYRDSKARSITSYGLRNFAVRRDGTGKLMDCVLREFTSVEALPDDLQQVLRAANRARYSRPEQTVKKYTRIHREVRNGNEGYAVTYQIDTFNAGEPGWYPTALCPWMVPTWTLIPGEHYGRGMVEDYAGGFAKLSTLSEASTLYSVEMMRVLNMVGAGSGSDPDDLANAESGEWVRGDPGSVSAYEAGEYQKLQQVSASIQEVIQRLAKAFMYEAMTRQAERVTAYELQQAAQEAEFTLGGVYSTLSGSIQVPMAHVLLSEVNDDVLAGLISGDVRPDVTAGIPALGRSADVQNVMYAAQDLGAIVPITQVDRRIDIKRLADLVYSGRSVDTDAIFFSKKEQEANQAAQDAQAQAQQSLVQADALANNSKTLESTLAGGQLA